MAGAIVSVEEFVKQNEVAPMRVGGKVGVAAVADTGKMPVLRRDNGCIADWLGSSKEGLQTATASDTIRLY